MRIVNRKRIRAFIEREPLAAPSLEQWMGLIRNGAWRDTAELKRTFASASFIKDLTVFNVGGNKYRIAAFIHYRKQIVYVKQIGTHKEYDQWEL